jgi:hypothetical protein
MGGDGSHKGDKSSHGGKHQQQQQNLFSTLVPLSHLVEVHPGTSYFPAGDAKDFKKKMASFKANLAALVAQSVKEAGLPETASFVATAATATAESSGHGGAAAAGAGAQGGHGSSSSSSTMVPPERCFTIVLRPRQQQQQSGAAAAAGGSGGLPPPSPFAAAGGGGQQGQAGGQTGQTSDSYGFNLELPPGGNGRSRDEWLDALRDLLPHHHHQQQHQQQEVVVGGGRGYKPSTDGSSSLGDMDFLSFSDNGDTTVTGRGTSGVVVAPGAASSHPGPGRQHPTAVQAAGAAAAAGRTSPLLDP